MSNTAYLFIESLQGTYEAGGVLMLPILITGAFGFYFLYASWWRIGGDYFKTDVVKNVEDLRISIEKEGFTQAKKIFSSKSGIVARELCYALDLVGLSAVEFQQSIFLRQMQSSRYLEKGTHVISMMARAAPLLGLLGTVTGMVATFNVITLYGNQNPVLMADGISEALITTQSGLLIAFPLTLLKQRLEERILLIQEQIELGVTIIANSMAEES